MTQYINLYRDGRRAQGVGRHSSMLLAALGCLLVFGLGGVAWLHFQAGRMEAGVMAAEAGVKTSQGRLADAARRVGGQGAVSKIADMEKLLKQRQALLATLDSGELGDLNGYSEYLRALGRQAGKGVWLISFDVARGGASLAIAGRSLDAERLPAYLAGLNGEKVFQGRKIAFLKAEGGKTEAGAVRDATSPPWVQFTLGTEPVRAAEPAPGAPDLVSAVASGKPLGSADVAGGARPPMSSDQSTAAAMGSLTAGGALGGKK